MEYYNSETHVIEFPRLFKPENKRCWNIYIRLIKTKHTHTNVDWDLMKEVHLPINSFDGQGVAQYWTETGMIGGKLTRMIPTYPSPKNIGKKNYRNTLQQAIFEAEAKYKKKIEEGFITIRHTETKDQKIFPMLAKPYQSGALVNMFPVLCQPKLDGLRCISYRDAHTNEIVMQSRTKKDFPPNQLNNAIRSQLGNILDRLPTGSYLDGELYTHDSKLQTINHYARDGGAVSMDDSVHLQYHIYDVIASFDTPFKKRVDVLNSLKIFESNIIQIVSTQWIHSQDKLDEYYSKCIQDGYEGTMIRNPDMGYVTKRSDGLLKRKEVFTNEYPIVDYTCGVKGKDLNAIIWICSPQACSPQAQQFKVTPNLSYKERYDLYKDCQKNFESKYKHRLLTVEYRALSIDRVPQHGKGVCIRDVE